MSQAWFPTLGFAATTGEMARPQAGERRLSRRYPLRIALDYRGAENNAEASRSGETSDISSKSVRFTAEAPPRAGAILELVMRWPLRLGDALPLRLIATGPVLRSDAREAVMLIKSFYFARVAEAENAEQT